MRSRHDIVSMYVSGMSIWDIKRRTGMSQNTIHRAVLNAGVGRSRTSGIRLAKNRALHLPAEALCFIDGLLLGDGHLTPSWRDADLYFQSRAR